jgi:hypothetical protein
VYECLGRLSVEQKCSGWWLALTSVATYLLAGNGSNIASANESNNDYSEDPSATQENSGLSTGGAELDLHFCAPAATSLSAPEVNTCLLLQLCDIL